MEELVAKRKTKLRNYMRRDEHVWTFPAVLDNQNVKGKAHRT
jgi:hypothetical protein